MGCGIQTGAGAVANVMKPVQRDVGTLVVLV